MNESNKWRQWMEMINDGGPEANRLQKQSQIFVKKTIPAQMQSAKQGIISLFFYSLHCHRVFSTTRMKF